MVLAGILALACAVFGIGLYVCAPSIPVAIALPASFLVLHVGGAGGGNNFSIADLNLASVMIRALQMDLKTYPHVHAWLNRCLDRPAALAARKLRDAA